MRTLVSWLARLHIGLLQSQDACLSAQLCGTWESTHWVPPLTSFPGVLSIRLRAHWFHGRLECERFLTTSPWGLRLEPPPVPLVSLAWLLIQLVHSYCSSYKFQTPAPSPSSPPFFMGGLRFSHSEPSSVEVDSCPQPVSSWLTGSCGALSSHPPTVAPLSFDKLFPFLS